MVRNLFDAEHYHPGIRLPQPGRAVFLRLLSEHFRRPNTSTGDQALLVAAESFSVTHRLINVSAETPWLRA